MICVAKFGENSQKLGKSADLFLYLILVVVVEMVEVAVEMKVVDMEGVNGATILVDSTGCSVW